MLKASLLGVSLSTSEAKARKCSNRASWASFCRLLEPRPESAQIDAPGHHFVNPWRHFVDFWSQGQKVLKSSSLDVILSTSGAHARKCSNRVSWTSFCRLLGPRPESAQIELPARHFIDFWSQGKKVFKSTSWASFCRLLEPRPIILAES